MAVLTSHTIPSPLLTPPPLHFTTAHLPRHHLTTSPPHHLTAHYLPTHTDTPDPTEDTPTPSLQGGVAQGVAKMISRPFTQSQIPQAKAKNNRKKITFANVDPYEAVALNESLEGEGQRACVVAATMAERICTGMGLTQLVQRVGDDRLREGGEITNNY